MSKYPPKDYVIRKYQPNQALGMNVPGTCIAGENVIFEAEEYSRVFGGWLDLSETNANELMAYTASLTANSPNITFSAGTPANDFAPYQHVLLGTQLHLIQKIDGLTAVIDPPATATGATTAVRRVPNLNPITRRKPERVSQYAGNAIVYREEAIFSAGRGPLKINGAAISAALTATDAVQVAYPIPGGSTYDVRPAGFTPPTAPTVTAIAGGTKGMTAQTFTFRASKKRQGFPGYGRASSPVSVALTAGQRFQVTFAAFDASEGQTSVQLWVSRNDDPTSGAWFLYGEFTGVGPHNVEWWDGELGTLYSDDNYPPPPSLYVASVNDFLLFVSALGKPDTSLNPTAPGPGVAVAKSNNPEAASPAAYAFVSPASDIVMVKVGKVGIRAQDSGVYFGTQEGISFGRFTDSTVSPLVINPAGSVGVSHNQSAVFAYDFLYAFSGETMIRTIDGANIETEFSRDVRTDLATIEKARAFVGFDQKNGWVVVFHANDRLGAGGGWQTRAWAFNVFTGSWHTPIALGDGVTDFTVCGVATVGQRLNFVTTDGKVWEWDANAGGASLAGFVAVNFDDWGDAAEEKIVREVKIVGGVGGTMKLYTNYTTVIGVPVNDILYLVDLVGGTGTGPELTISGPSAGLGSKTYQVWRPNKHFREMAWRLAFNTTTGLRLLDKVSIVAHGRGGMRY